MSNFNIIPDVALVLHCLADSIRMIADSMDAASGTTTEAPAPTQPEPATGKPVAEKSSIEDVRAVLADKSAAGKTAEVRALLYKYDAGKLSGVKPEDYPALLEEAKLL